MPSVAAHLIRCIAVNIKNPETLPTTPNFVSHQLPLTTKQRFGLQGPVVGLVGTKHLQDIYDWDVDCIFMTDVFWRIEFTFLRSNPHIFLPLPSKVAGKAAPFLTLTKCTCGCCNNCLMFRFFAVTLNPWKIGSLRWPALFRCRSFSSKTWLSHSKCALLQTLTSCNWGLLPHHPPSHHSMLTSSLLHCFSKITLSCFPSGRVGMSGTGMFNAMWMRNGTVSTFLYSLPINYLIAL